MRSASGAVSSRPVDPNWIFEICHSRIILGLQKWRLIAFYQKWMNFLRKFIGSNKKTINFQWISMNSLCFYCFPWFWGGAPEGRAPQKSWIFTKTKENPWIHRKFKEIQRKFIDFIKNDGISYGNSLVWSKNELPVDFHEFPLNFNEIPMF